MAAAPAATIRTIFISGPPKIVSPEPAHLKNGNRRTSLLRYPT